MKNSMLMMTLLLSATGAMAASKPPGGDPCGRIEKSYQWMKDSLPLNAGQQAQVAVWKDDACAKLKAAAEKTAGDDARFREEAGVIMKEYRQKVKSVLSHEQQERLKQRREQAKSRHHGPMKPEDKAEKMTAVMKEKLALTAAQESSIKTANLDFVKKQGELRAKRKAGADSAALREEARRIRKEYDAAVKKILTPDQLPKWEALKQEMRQKRSQKHKGR